MDLIREMNAMAFVDQTRARLDMKKIADYWNLHGRDMSDDDLREAIGYDLEMLEYTPEQVEAMVPTILQMLDR